jgi:Tol biopolymer transport system component
MTMNPTDGAAQIQDNGKYMALSRRGADGPWKIARDIWTRFQTPEPSAPLWSVFLLALVMAVSPAASAQTAAGRIVFLSMRDGEFGLFVMEADGSDQTRLTSGDIVAPVWSPDGCKIVFRQGLGEIDVINADGSDQTVVVPRTGGGDPQSDFRSHFSPDGARILFHARGLSSRNRDFFVVDADGSNPVNLTNNTQVDADWLPSWSPDGTTILFASRRAPRGIYIMNADGTGRRRLSSGNRPVWSPDGSKIALPACARGTGF